MYILNSVYSVMNKIVTKKCLLMLRKFCAAQNTNICVWFEQFACVFNFSFSVRTFLILLFFCI